MRASGGGCAAEGHCYSSARRLLGGDGGVAPAASSSTASLDAQRARLETALCATTAVLFAASLSYVALSALFSCFRAARRPQRLPDAEPGPPSSADAAETKRALQEIPVVVVQVRKEDPDRCDRNHVGGAKEEEAAAGDEECAVCLAAYAGGEEVRVLPGCRHGFHRECVDRWLLTRAPTCPVCRATVVAASSEGRHAKGCATGDAVGS